jgi:hypothetical protein
MALSFMTKLEEKNGFLHHNIISLRGITESINFFSPNAGLVTPFPTLLPPKIF